MDFERFLTKLEKSLEVIRSLIGNPYVEIIRNEITKTSDNKVSNPLLVDDMNELSNQNVGISNTEVRVKVPCVYTSGLASIKLDEKVLGEVLKLKVYIKKSDIENSELKEIRNNDKVYLNGKEYEIESIKDAYRFWIISLR